MSEYIDVEDRYGCLTRIVAAEIQVISDRGSSGGSVVYMKGGAEFIVRESYHSMLRKLDDARGPK